MKKLVLVAAFAMSAAVAAAPANAVSFQYPQVTGNVLMLGATERANLTTVESNNTTYRVDNGLQWFNWNDGEEGSMGFAATTAALELESCDVNVGNDDVLCWHGANVDGDDVVTQGYRWNDEQDVDANAGVYRIMFTSDDPGYYPSGAQYDVPIEDLDGWTACWADDWGVNWGDVDVTYTDLFAACDGDYLMMAVVENVTEGDAPFTVGGSDALAETGFDATPLAAFASIALAAGVVAMRRRRTN